MKNGNPYITVDNRKELEVDAVKSEKLGGREGGSAGEPKLQDMLVGTNSQQQTLIIL